MDSVLLDACTGKRRSMQGYWSLGPFGVSLDSETLAAPGALPGGPRCARLPDPVSGQIDTGLEQEGLTWP